MYRVSGIIQKEWYFITYVIDAPLKPFSNVLNELYKFMYNLILLEFLI